jgi:hypothetical protein
LKLTAPELHHDAHERRTEVPWYSSSASRHRLVGCTVNRVVILILKRREPVSDVITLAL